MKSLVNFVSAALLAVPLVAGCVGRIGEGDDAAGAGAGMEGVSGGLPPSGGSIGAVPRPGSPGAVPAQPGAMPKGADPACKQNLPVPGPAPLRRLTRVEYNNTVRDLLGDTSQPANAFEAEPTKHGFTNDADSLWVTEGLAEQLVTAAEAIAGRAAANLARLLPCAPAQTGEDVCARRFVETFGRRTFRRPLDVAENARYVGLYTRGRQGADFATGIRWVIQAMLIAPSFLYRVEGGMPGPSAAVLKLTPWELASRLSYLAWGSMPDEALMTAAAAGQLETPAQLEAQARRLLASPKARAVVARFHGEWLELDLIDQLDKDTRVYRTFAPALRKPMRQETEKFLDYTVWDGPGDLGTMLTGRFTFLSKDLAPLYDAGAPTQATFERVDLDPGRRAGFLTHAGILAAHSKADQSSPVGRGKFVREALFCTELQPPPPNVDGQLPEVSSNATTRERFSQHSSVPSCAGCHGLIDPVGFAFENYDGVGKWRDVESGKRIDASGSLAGTDIDGAFVGAVALAEKMAGSADVRRCFVKQWFRFAHGRVETSEDACTLTMLEQRLMAKGNNVRELLVALTQTDAFTFKPAGGAP